MTKGKKERYSVCEFITDENGTALEFTPVPICITDNLRKLRKFLDDYILHHIKVTDKDDKFFDVKTELSITVDQNWWKNRNNKNFPLGLADDFPSYIVIKQNWASHNSGSYVCLHINRSLIEFL